MVFKTLRLDEITQGARVHEEEEDWTLGDPSLKVLLADVGKSAKETGRSGH